MDYIHRYVRACVRTRGALEALAKPIKGSLLSTMAHGTDTQEFYQVTFCFSLLETGSHCVAQAGFPPRRPPPGTGV
jgi:hypothetical protein